MQVSVPVPAVALGIWGAMVAVGGVHGTDVPAVLVTTVPEAVPNAHKIVWVNPDEARVMVIAPALPIVKAPQVMVEALGMVFSVPDPLPEIVPMNCPLKVMLNCCEKLNEKDLVPSALCGMVTVPDHNTLL